MTRSPLESDAWTRALADCADPERARRQVGLLLEAGLGDRLGAATAEQARVLAALLSGAQFLGEWLVGQPAELEGVWDVEALRFPRPIQGLRREVQAWLTPLLERQEEATAWSHLRRFHARQNLRITARDLAGFATLEETVGELSDLAEVCLESVHEIGWDRLTRRLGRPWHQTPEGEWVPTPFCVLGMGKLGGRELNYSSDVDVLFVYEEEGRVFREPPRPGQPAGGGQASHHFFKRHCEAFIEEVRRLAPEGQLYRIDLRLRPEGALGPLARSLAGYENYYAQYGQTWERMMLIKARRVAGDRTLAGEFLEMIQPFRYPRLLSPRFLQDIAAMKRRTEAEVVRAGEIDRNIKLGRGGIREIEFIAQALQILQAGKTPFLADPQTLPALRKLVRYGLLEATEADDLTAAYEFLRKLEHRLQMEHNRQTHTLPADVPGRRRLARLMGFARQRDFEAQLEAHRVRVRALYERVVPLEAADDSRLPPFEGREGEWKERLAGRGFRDPDQALRLARTFVHGPGFALVTARTEELGRELLQHLLSVCPPVDGVEERRRRAGPDGDPEARWLSDPDRVLTRLDSFVSAYGARAGLYESWVSNPSLFGLLLRLFDRSEFLAETALREVDLVDALEQSGRLRQTKTVEQTLEDLRHGRRDADQPLWLRRYHRAEFMRIGLRDILGLADFEQNLEELTALAEACLSYALEVVLRQNRYRKAPLAIIGLGKLGGAELNYGSDLDILLVADNRQRDLPALQRVAAEFIELIGRQTEAGSTFPVDVRLRPDGDKGLLVNTLSTCQDYYRRRAWLWEVQALSRARPVAGNPAVGRAFMELVQELVDFRNPDPERVAAHKPGWQQEIVNMRARIERERVKPGREPLAIKTGAGGLMDAEFIAQTACLEQGWIEPNTRRALERAGTAGRLDPATTESLVANYRRLRRVEGILRRWSYVGETELPTDDAPLHRVAVRCGFATTDDFLAAVGRYRTAIRQGYRAFFGLAEAEA